MARYLYINPDPATQTRAATLGCGWMPAVPLDFAAQVAGRVPCVIVSGLSSTVVLPEPTTVAAVTTAAQPIVDAETAAVAAQATLDTNKALLTSRANTALTNNTTYLAIATPTNAQVVAQVAALTRECNALIRLTISLFDSTAGT